MNKPFAPSCERNQDAIFQVLKPLLRSGTQVLEIGSGTGQHAVYFCERSPGVTWQTSDLRECHEGICTWIEESPCANVLHPIELNVLKHAWPSDLFDLVYTANTFHMMSWDAVSALIQGAGAHLNEGGHLIVYGPFNIDGEYTSPRNAAFDQQLRAENPQRGLRECHDVDSLAKEAGLEPVERVPMPANNLTLIYRLKSQ